MNDAADGSPPRPVWGPAIGELVRRGLIGGGAVLDGDVVVEPASRSNEVGIVRSAGHPVAVLKRPVVPLDGVDPLVAERAAYRALAGAGVSSPTPAPALLAEFHGVLAIEVVEGRPLHDVLSDAWSGPADGAELRAVLAELGRTLAVVHAARPGRALPHRRPWVLDLAVGLPPLLAPDPALRALAAEVAVDGTLSAVLEGVGSRWRAEALMHGDVKFDNVIVTPRGQVVLIDWELGGLGWPAWDLAGIVDGLVVPAVTALDRNPTAGWAEAEIALGAYARHPAAPRVDRTDIVDATVARLIQSAVQLTAMRHRQPDGVDLGRRVLAAARRIATSTAMGGAAA